MRRSNIYQHCGPSIAIISIISQWPCTAVCESQKIANIDRTTLKHTISVITKIFYSSKMNPWGKWPNIENGIGQSNVNAVTADGLNLASGCSWPRVCWVHQSPKKETSAREANEHKQQREWIKVGIHIMSTSSSNLFWNSVIVPSSWVLRNIGSGIVWYSRYWVSMKLERRKSCLTGRWPETNRKTWREMLWSY